MCASRRPVDAESSPYLVPRPRASYQYQPLANGNTIRLIELDPIPLWDIWFSNETDHKIFCSMKVFSLADAPNYEALSYCWGKEGPTAQVICDGSELKISPNLHEALNGLRRNLVNSKRLIWADAICINQEDIIERNQQVTMMRDIYQRAFCVLVWLGGEANNSKEGFDFARRLLRASERQAASSDTRNSMSMSLRELDEHFGPGFNLVGSSARALWAICDRDWFQRIWVVQEVAVARDVLVMCGSSEISWDDFSGVLKYSQEKGLTMFFGTERLEKILKIDLTRSEFLDSGPAANRSDPQGVDLLRLLFRHQERLSTDPRDMIYTLRGLSNNHASLGVQVDYNLHAADVYRKSAIAILSIDGNLDLLGACQAREERYTDAEPALSLPSWIPDWSTSYRATSLMLKGLPQGRHLNFTAAKNCLHMSPKFSADQTQLCLMGHFVDSIDKVIVGTVTQASDLSAIRLWDIFGIYHTLARNIYDDLVLSRKWQTLAGVRQKTLKYINGESMLDAYWQTIICGLVEPEGYTATKEMYDQIKGDGQRYSFYSERWIWPFWLFIALSTIGGLFVAFSYFCGRKPKGHDLRFHQKAIHLNSGEWLFMKTVEGRIGLVPLTAKPRDRIGLFKGGKVPLIVRRAADASLSWQLIGECYVHGIMYGEAFEEEKCEQIWIC